MEITPVMDSDIERFAGPKHHEICRIGVHKGVKYNEDFLAAMAQKFSTGHLRMTHEHEDFFNPIARDIGFMTHLSAENGVLYADIYFLDPLYKNKYDCGEPMGFSIMRDINDGYTEEDVKKDGVTGVNSSLASVSYTKTPYIQTTMVPERPVISPVEMVPALSGTRRRLFSEILCNFNEKTATQVSNMSENESKSEVAAEPAVGIDVGLTADKAGVQVADNVEMPETIPATETAPAEVATPPADPTPTLAETPVTEAPAVAPTEVPAEIPAVVPVADPVMSEVPVAVDPMEIYAKAQSQFAAAGVGCMDSHGERTHKTLRQRAMESQSPGGVNELVQLARNLGTNVPDGNSPQVSQAGAPANTELIRENAILKAKIGELEQKLLFNEKKEKVSKLLVLMHDKGIPVSPDDAKSFLSKDIVEINTFSEAYSRMPDKPVASQDNPTALSGEPVRRPVSLSQVLPGGKISPIAAPKKEQKIDKDTRSSLPTADAIDYTVANGRLPRSLGEQLKAEAVAREKKIDTK